MLRRELSHLRGVVVSQEHVTLVPPSQAEQPLMVELADLVEPASRALAAGSIGRVNEEHGVLLSDVGPHHSKAVAVAEVDPISILNDGANASRQSLRIPAGRYTFAVFPSPHQPRAGGHDATALRPVAKDGLECQLHLEAPWHCQLRTDAFLSELERLDTAGEPLRISVDEHLPYGGDVGVKFDKDRPIYKVLGDSRQPYDASAGKRLYEKVRSTWLASEPRTKLRNQPRLAAGIAKH